MSFTSGKRVSGSLSAAPDLPPVNVCIDLRDSVFHKHHSRRTYSIFLQSSLRSKITRSRLNKRRIKTLGLTQSQRELETRCCRYVVFLQHAERCNKRKHICTPDNESSRTGRCVSQCQSEPYSWKSGAQATYREPIEAIFQSYNGGWIGVHVSEEAKALGRRTAQSSAR